MTEEDSYTTTPQKPTFLKGSIRFDTFAHRSLAGKGHLTLRCSLAVFWSKSAISRGIGHLPLAIHVV